MNYNNSSTNDTIENNQKILLQDAETQLQTSSIPFFVRKTIDRLGLTDSATMKQNSEYKLSKIKLIPDSKIQITMLEALVQDYKEKVLMIDQILTIGKKLNQERNLPSEFANTLCGIYSQNNDQMLDNLLEYYQKQLDKIEEQKQNIVNKHVASQKQLDDIKKKELELMYKVKELEARLTKSTKNYSKLVNGNKKKGFWAGLFGKD